MTMCSCQRTPGVSCSAPGMRLRIVCNDKTKYPHTAVTGCYSFVPPSHSFVPPILLSFQRYDPSSLSVKNPLRTLPRSWLNQHKTCFNTCEQEDIMVQGRPDEQTKRRFYVDKVFFSCLSIVPADGGSLTP